MLLPSTKVFLGMSNFSKARDVGGRVARAGMAVELGKAKTWHDDEGAAKRGRRPASFTMLAWRDAHTRVDELLAQRSKWIDLSARLSLDGTHRADAGDPHLMRSAAPL